MKVTLIIASILLVVGFAFAAGNLPVLSESSSGMPNYKVSDQAPMAPLTAWTLQYDDGTCESGLACSSSPNRNGSDYDMPDMTGAFDPLGEIIQVDFYSRTIIGGPNAFLYVEGFRNPTAPGGSCTGSPNWVNGAPTVSMAWSTVNISPGWAVHENDNIIVDVYHSTTVFYLGRDTTAPHSGRSYICSSPCGITTWTGVTSIGFPGDWGIHVFVDDTLPVELFSFTASANQDHLTV